MKPPEPKIKDPVIRRLLKENPGYKVKVYGPGIIAVIDGDYIHAAVIDEYAVIVKEEK